MAYRGSKSLLFSPIQCPHSPSNFLLGGWRQGLEHRLKDNDIEFQCSGRCLTAKLPSRGKKSRTKNKKKTKMFFFLSLVSLVCAPTTPREQSHRSTWQAKLLPLLREGGSRSRRYILPPSLSGHYPRVYIWGVTGYW